MYDISDMAILRQRIHRDCLVAAIEAALTRPPAITGRRLRSERSLAQILKVDRMRVHHALDRLVAKGILVRRACSGTYVRRIPYGPLPPGSLPALVLDPTRLFAQETIVTPSRRRPISMPRFRLGLISDLHYTTAVNRRILAGMVGRARACGQRLIIYAVQGGDGKTITPGGLHRAITKNPCEGYLVLTGLGNHFVQATGDQHPPAVFFSSGCTYDRHEPIFQFDTINMIEQAIRILHGQGSRRIAMFGLGDFAPNTELHRTAYRQTLKLLGLKYQAVEFPPFNETEILAAARRLLRRFNPPEAVCVADDNLLAPLLAEARSLRRFPGRDLAIITHSNRGFPLPPGLRWSRLEFDPELFGCMLVDALLRQVQTAGAEAVSIKILARWIEGETHRLSVASSYFPDRRRKQLIR